MEHYFSSKPRSSLHEKKITYKSAQKQYLLTTASSIFSKDQIDQGTDLLIRSLGTLAGKRVLDIGCGYGVVGIVAASKGAKVVMSDVNQRALLLATKNCKANGVDAKIVCSDLYSAIDETFDLILSNPPHSAGKKLCMRLIEESSAHLELEGELRIVARHNKGGKSLSRHMLEIFGNIKTIARGSGYHVYASKKLYNAGSGKET